MKIRSISPIFCTLYYQSPFLKRQNNEADTRDLCSREISVGERHGYSDQGLWKGSMYRVRGG